MIDTSNESGNDWREWNADKKAAAQRRMRENTEVIAAWCSVKNYGYVEIAPHHLRVAGTIDIFPQTKKYHNLNSNHRGTIKGDIGKFLDKQF